MHNDGFSEDFNREGCHRYAGDESDITKAGGGGKGAGTGGGGGDRSLSSNNSSASSTTSLSLNSSKKSFKIYPSRYYVLVLYSLILAFQVRLCF